MFIYDRSDKGMNRFLFISVIIHALIFITFPQWRSLLISDVASLEKGGVIQVVNLETSTSRQLSPVPSRVTQSPVPRVEEPKPRPEPPKQEAVAAVEPDIPEPEVPRPRPQPEPVPEPPREQPVEPVPEERPQEEELAAQPPENEESPTTSERELLTSEAGEEVVIQEEPEQSDPEPEESVQQEAREENPPPQRSEEPAEREPLSESLTSEESGPSASGTADASGSGEQAGQAESGTGESETAPPPPPPPPSGRSLHAGGGSPIYPKNAEHDGVEGTVRLEALVSASGEIQRVRVIESSGDARLDEQALRTVERLWRFSSAAQDYILPLDVTFARIQENGIVRFSSDIAYGEVRWADE